MFKTMRDEYLEAMGITQWLRRSPRPLPAITDSEEVQHAVDTVEHEQPVPEHETVIADIELTPTQTRESHCVDGLGWDELAARVAECKLCDLHATRNNTVFGVGDREADLLVIGEAPGADEDRQGEPFVGRAGQLLDSMLLAMGLRREQVYIANILKCRPPQNRDPLPEEVESCQPYLRRQIELLKPKVILAVGRVAAQNLLGTSDTMKVMRGQHFEYADTGIPVVVTYHPAYLLRSPLEKRKSWQDLQFAMRLYAKQAEAAQ